jgi:hypothetical protein
MATFDLWMSKGHHDTFTFIINFLLVDWKPHRVTIGVFEDNDTMGMGLAKQLKAILEKNCLMSKVLCYVKDEGTNFVNMTVALKSVISCKALNLPQPFNGTYFGHTMNKAFQYATNDDKIF